jgi:succinoglycan biosynthesis transport protein ExoP
MSARPDTSRRADQPSESPESLPLNFVDFYDIVIARWRLLIPALAFSLAIALVYVLVAPTRYSASLSLLVDPRERAPVGVEAQPVPQNPDPALVESQMRVLTSKAVLRRVVESEDLVDDPEFRPGLIGRFVAAVGSIFRGGSSHAKDPTDAIVESLGRRIAVKRSERTYIVDVDVSASTPEMAVKLGNALVAAYFRTQTALSDEIVNKQTAWLDSRVNDLRARVEEAERRVQDYRDKNSIALTDGHTSPERQLGDANAALVVARGKLAEVEARYTQLKNAASRSDPGDSTDDTLRSPVIEKLRQDYSALAKDEAYELTVLGPRHPTYLTTLAQLNAVRTQIKAEIQRILLATEREFKAAQAAEQSAERLVSSTETSTNKLGDESLELKDLEREAATLRATFEKTLAARENVRRDVVESPLGLVVDPAIAGTSRTSPKVLPAFILALAAGVNLWIAAALIADFRERKRAPKPPPPVPAPPPPEAASAPVSEAPRKKAAPFGGFVVSTPGLSNSFPPSPPGRPGGRSRSIANTVADAMRDERLFGRSIRTLYGRLVDRFGEDQTTTRIALTSCASDARGSIIALSLADAAFEDEQRVLLVDCDGADSTLSKCISEQESAAWPGRRRSAGRNPGDERVRGEVVVVPLDRGRSLDRELDRLSDFDLVILYCGSIPATAAIANRWNVVDAVVLVAKGRELDPDLLDELQAAGLADRCIGAVLTADEERAKKRA